MLLPIQIIQYIWSINFPFGRYRHVLWESTFFLKSHASCVSPSGDLTENQKKIFKANQFYRGLAIPEPQETVGGVLKLGRSHTSQGLYSLSLYLHEKKKCRQFLGKLRLLCCDQFLND